MQKERILIVNWRQGGFFYWLLKYYVFAVSTLILTIGYIALGFYLFLAFTLPPLPPLSHYKDIVFTTSSIYAADGTLLAEIGREREEKTSARAKKEGTNDQVKEYREFVPISAIPQPLIQALLATEDRRFYEHHGVDLRGLTRAIYKDIKAGKLVEGGSTLTQQVVKWYLTWDPSSSFVEADKSFKRKLKEMLLARKLEVRYSKEQILEVYLNNVAFGHIPKTGVELYGVQAAAKNFFNRDVKDLTLPQMALLVGMIKKPPKYSPFAKSAKDREERKNQVFQNMVEAGYLSQAQADDWKTKPLEIVSKHNINFDVSPYFIDQIKRSLKQMEPQLKQVDATWSLDRGGYRIETTLVPFFDVMAQENVDHAVRKLDKRQGYRGPVYYLVSDSDRKEFLEKAKKLYNTPLVEGKIYLGLVSKTTENQALVWVGDTQYKLPLRNMRWAHQYSRTEETNDHPISSVTQAIKEGDVIWVSLAPKKPTARFTDYKVYNKVNEHGFSELDAEWISPQEESKSPKEPELILEQIPQVQGATYTFDWETGYVLAMAGGSDYDLSQFNRTTQACLQPGSAYKPVYYSLALEQGYSFDTMLRDRIHAELDPITGELWTPTNVDKQQTPLVTLERALTWSKNPPSVELFKKLGAKQVEAWARKLGFTTKISADDALALGASCVRLDEISHAFALFPRNGKKLEPISIKRIIDRNGRVVWDRSAWYDPEIDASSRLDRMMSQINEEPEQVISPRAAWLTTKLLRNVVAEGHSAPIRAAKLIAAGKTGTSSRTSDVWFVGFTSKWFNTVWVGNDLKEKARQLGLKDASFTISVPMWARYIYAATRFLEEPMQELPLERPASVKPNDRGGPRPKESKTAKESEESSQTEKPKNQKETKKTQEIPSGEDPPKRRKKRILEEPNDEKPKESTRLRGNSDDRELSKDHELQKKVKSQKHDEETRAKKDRSSKETQTEQSPRAKSSNEKEKTSEGESTKKKRERAKTEAKEERAQKEHSSERATKHSVKSDSNHVAEEKPSKSSQDSDENPRRKKKSKTE